MLTLDVRLHIPDHILFTPTTSEYVILLNTRLRQYYELDEIGVRLWNMLNEDRSLREIHQALSDEYEVPPQQLEQDLLELIGEMLKNGLVEIV